MATYNTDLKDGLQATLAARQDLGSDYDDAFVDSFMDKLGAKVVQELQHRHEVRPIPTSARRDLRLTAERRLTIALLSLFLIVALFILGQLDAGTPNAPHTLLTGCMVASGAIFLLNLALNLNVRGYLQSKGR